jgi:ABC-type branched-subunit amino acid transport system substrate-binding protein
MAIVSCDETNEPRRAAEHMAIDLGVPAVVGFVRSADVVDLAPSIFMPRGTVAMVTMSTAAVVTALPQPPEGRLVWRTTVAKSRMAAPTSAFIEQILEPRIRGSSANKRLRVGLLRPKQVGLRDFAADLLASLRFNGKSAIDNGDDYREFVQDDDADSMARVVQDLRGFKPDIVVTILYAAGLHGIIEPLEKAWPATAPRPVYVSPNEIEREVFEFIGTDVSRRHRFFGITSVASTAPNARFVAHYNETFPNKVTRTFAPNTSYDGFYALAYAALALPPGPVSGHGIAGAFPRLDAPGKLVAVGPQSIYDAYSTLRAGGGIDLEGTVGHLDLDPATGESSIDMAILCVSTDDHGRANDTVESGLVFDAKGGRLIGEPRCP